MKYIFLLFTLCLPLSSSAIASDIDIYGTLAQGYIRTNTNNYFGDSTRGSFDFREIGVGAGLKVTDDLRASGLLMSRKAGSTADGKIDVDYLMADYAAIKTEDATYGIKIGRQKIPFGFYNETRDIAETRPSVLLPQSIYFDNARQYLINADGVQLYRDKWSDGSYLKTQLSFMRTNGANNAETKTFFFGFQPLGDFQSRFAKALRVEYTYDGTELAATISRNSIAYIPGAGDFLASGYIDMDSMWLSARHTFKKIILTTELFSTRSRYRDFGPYFPNTTNYPLGTYVQGEWLASDKWQFYSRYDLSFANSHDMNGSKLSAASGKPTTAFYAKDIMVGGRYRFTATTSLAAEIHFVHGTLWLPVSDNLTNPINPNYNIFAMQLSHSF